MARFGIRPLVGQFAQGTEFTNNQAFQFTIDYGDGGLNNGGTFNQDVVLTLVPEPGTLVLVDIALLALAGYATRRD